MLSLFRTCSVFISHKRHEGKVSFDASWFEEKLRGQRFFKTFMDVREVYVGPFPKILEEKIKKSDVFLLVLPFDRDLNYLSDPNNWVHKEIRYALSKKEQGGKDFKIIPVSFKDNITFPSKDVLGDIADIVDYNIICFDINDQENSQKRLYNSIGYKSWKYYLTWKSIVFAILLLCCFKLLGNFPSEKYYEEVIQNYTETVNNMTPMLKDVKNGQDMQLANELQEGISNCFALVSKLQPINNSNATKEERLNYYTSMLKNIVAVNSYYIKLEKLYEQLYDIDSGIVYYCGNPGTSQKLKDSNMAFNKMLSESTKQLIASSSDAELILSNIFYNKDLWEYLDEFRKEYVKVYNGLSFWQESRMNE